MNFWIYVIVGVLGGHLLGLLVAFLYFSHKHRQLVRENAGYDDPPRKDER